MVQRGRKWMSADHAIYRDLQRHWHQNRDRHREYPEKKYPDQMGIAWPCQFEQALKEERAIRMIAIGQCR